MKVIGRKLWAGLGMTLGVALLAACGGDTDFSGSARQTSDLTVEPAPAETPPPPVVEPPVEEIPPLLEPFASLTWHWQCASAPGALPAPATDEDVLVSGVGPHEFLQGELSGTPITFSGELCPPEALPRDIVFVIDVSGSMETGGTGNDSEVNGSCARLRAVENVISSVPAGIGRFGIVTFSDASDPAKNSTQLWGDQQQLATDLQRGGSSMAQTVCATSGSTFYQPGLMQARRLLEMGDALATKEIYFISDGQPQDRGVAKTQASLLRYPGVNAQGTDKPVTIATVMLGGSDTALETEIASKVDDGQGNLVPLHAYVTDTNQLTSVLAELSSNEITDAQLKYRAIGSTDWSELSLMDHLTGFEFSIPAADLDPTSAGQGIEVYFSYKDSHNNLFESGGKLIWVEDASEIDLSLRL